MRKSTHIELVQELTERNKEGKYDDIIARAKEKGYHDFKFDEDKYPDCICPKMDLVKDLSDFPELSDIRGGVMGGEFDESPDEDDERKMIEEMPFMEQLINRNKN